MGLEFDATKIPFLIDIMTEAIKDGREWGMTLLNESNQGHDRKKIASHAINTATLWSIGKGIATGVIGIVGIPLDIIDAVHSQVKLSAALFTIHECDTASEANWIFIVSAALGMSAANLAQHLGFYTIKALNKVLLPKSFRLIMKMNQSLALKFGAKIYGKNVVKAAKVIPAIGGVIGGSVNGVTMLLCGNWILSFIDDLREGWGGFSLSPA